MLRAEADAENFEQRLRALSRSRCWELRQRAEADAVVCASFPHQSERKEGCGKC